MTWPRLVRAELRKLTTTRMPWAFLVVLVLFAVINAVAITIGTDADGSKAFIATAADQASLLAWGQNAFLIAGLLGAIAAAREYGHTTVVPTFLASPRRHRTVLAQLSAVVVAGATLGVVGGGLVVATGAASLPFTDYPFLLSAATVARIVAVSTLAGAAGALLGSGVGWVVRNAGGAVAATGLLMFIAPPLIAQLASGTGPWMPATLVSRLSGVADGPALPAAVAVLVVWAAVPALAGLVTVQRRDIV